MAKDYAIVPEEEVLKLKSDVEKIKRNPFQAYGSEDLIESINNMTKAINSLIELFRTAAEEMKLEERETETIGRRIEPMFAKLDMLVDQNQKIARGVVAVADMLERQPSAREEQISLPPPSMQPRPFAPQSPMSPQRMQGMPPPMGAPKQMGMPPAPAGMPMPPPPAKKKSFFG